MYVQKLQFISHKLWPSSNSNGQLRELVFFSRNEALIFLKRHTRLFGQPVIGALLFVSLMATLLVQSLNKKHMKCFSYKVQNDNAYFMNQKTLPLNFKSSRSFFKIGVLKIFAIFAGKHLCWSYLLIVTGLDAWNFVKKRLQHRCFLANIAKFLRSFILKNVCERRCFCTSNQ